MLLGLSGLQLVVVGFGLLVWLLLDRRSRSTARTVVLERTDDPAVADVRLDRVDAGAPPARTTPTERTPEQ